MEYYKLLFLIIFINLFSSSFQNICNSNDNTICESCDSEDNIYSSCKYENLYCALTKEKNIYSQCKKMYNKYLRNDDNICGKKDIFFTANTQTNTILQINKDIINNNNLDVIHCDYDLKINNLNDSSTNKLNITLTLENGYRNDNFNFFFFLLKNNIFNSDNLVTKEKLISNKKSITLEYFQNISLYIDIKNIQKNYIPELSIKIEYINAENEEGEEIEMEKEDMYSLYLTLYIAIPLLIMLVALIIYLCCKKQDTGLLGGEIRVIGFSNDNETGEENEENKSKAHKLNENKKKLIVLFKTILSARKYEKTHNKIDCPRCTICYEDFELSNSVVSITPCQHIFHYKCLNNWLNQNILNPKCPNCNFDLMTIDISKLKNKPQNVLNKLPVKRESSVNENLLNKVNKDSKKSRHTLNNDINITRNRRRNYINGYSNNNRRTITISHMSFNYNLSGNSDNKKSKDCNANTNKRSNDEENEDEKESGKYDDNQNIYSSQNCLNEEDEKIENNNINNIYKMKKNNNSSKKSEDKTDNSCRISNENSERTIINKKNNKIEMIKNSEIVNTEENESENKSNKEYDDITSINITDSKKSYNNESSSKKEEYKTLSQDIKNSMKKPLN